MRKILTAALLAICCGAMAQTPISKYKPGVTPEGAVYYLPKTALRIVVQVEKTTYTPGDFCIYADRFLRLKDVETEKTVDYKVTTINMTSVGVADTSKCYSIKLNPKSSATNIRLADDGTLTAINAEPTAQEAPAAFVPAPKKAPVNPRQFMNEDILAAGSTAKMAQLTAQEIYDIRESKSLLTRGQADFMPKDGAQMKLMLEQLDTQDKALTSLFAGTTEKDTTEHVFIVCPDKEISKEVLFRLSRRLGIVDKDDLSGTPYYISVTDLHSIPAADPVEPAGKRKQQDNGIFVNVPGKIKATISKGNHMMGSFVLYAGQFGHTELLSSELFNKRFSTRLILNPTTGSVARLDAEQPK